MESKQAPKQNIDWWTFSASVGAIIMLSLPMVLAPDLAGQLIEQAYDFLTNNLGFLYQWYSLAVFVFLIYLGFSRYGAVRLGAEDSKPEFGNLSWVAMLFSAGIGAGLLYWAVIEWGYYLDSPPFGVPARSNEAIEWAASYGLFTGVLTLGHFIACLRSPSLTHFT